MGFYRLYTTATLGTQMADPNRRNILLIGDGSLQLTVQELSTMIRQDIKPIIFVINNDGYTVERLIHGMEETYNDIRMWDYKALPKVFGGDNVVVHDVKTSNDLQNVFDAINAAPEQLHFTEVTMKWDDAPAKLRDISKAFADRINRSSTIIKISLSHVLPCHRLFASYTLFIQVFKINNIFRDILKMFYIPLTFLIVS